MSALIIAAGLLALAGVLHWVWRLEPKGLRAADIEAMAWEQMPEEPRRPSGQPGIPAAEAGSLALRPV